MKTKASSRARKVPTPIFLVMDVSNSFAKWGWARGGRLSGVRKCATSAITLPWLRSLLRASRGTPLVLSSVVPSATRKIRTVFGKRLFEIHGKADLPLGIRYPKPAQIGADRLANAVAARVLYGCPAIVIDFGTAVTFDVVDAEGAYCGGVIAPGLNAMTDYLHEKTALLPRITVREPKRAIGKSTEQAMRAGAVIGYRGLAKEIVKALSAELSSSRKTRVVATGGQAELVARGMREIHAVHPYLTLEGLRLIGESWL